MRRRRFVFEIQSEHTLPSKTTSTMCWCRLPLCTESLLVVLWRSRVRQWLTWEVKHWEGYWQNSWKITEGSSRLSLGWNLITCFSVEWGFEKISSCGLLMSALNFGSPFQGSFIAVMKLLQPRRVGHIFRTCVRRCLDICRPHAAGKISSTIFPVRIERTSLISPLIISDKDSSYRH